MAKRAKKKRLSSTSPTDSRSSQGLSLKLGWTWLQLLQASLIVAAVFVIYWPALEGDFVSDDKFYLAGNTLLQEPARLWKAWFVPGSFIEYYPITQSLQWFEWQLWGTETLGYHLANVVLHIISSLLVWRLLDKLGLRWGWLGGLLFAIHPMVVESVAWISELKNSLSLPPFLLAMCAWIDYEESKRARDYLSALGWFLVAMLCKISMAPFPVMILVFAWWKRGRIGIGDLKASAPFFAISLALGVLSIHVAYCFSVTNPRIADPIPLGGILSRLACVGTTLTFYLVHCFVPVAMSPSYPMWRVDPPSLWQVTPWLLFGGLFYWLWRERRGWGRHVLLALLFFFLFLAPFAGFIPISFMAYTWVMDHFAYIALIGWVGLVVAASEQLTLRMTSSVRQGFFGVIALLLGFLAWDSHAYAEVYTSDKAFWTYALTQNPGAWLPHNNLGSDLMNEGRTAQAIDEFRQTLRMNPNSILALNDLGNALDNEGRTPEAIDQFEQALRDNPGFAEGHYNLGLAFLKQGRNQDALDQFEKAVQFNPSYAEAHNNLGNLLQEAGRTTDAMEQYEQALHINPNLASAHNGMGNALATEGRTDEAITQYEQALQINPNFAEAYIGLGNILQNEGRMQEAITQYEQALRINPYSAEAHNDVGCALQGEGRPDEAIAHFEQALQINPNLATAQSNLARLRAVQKTPVKK